MIASEKRELAGLALVVAAVALLRARLPHRAALGDLLMAAAVLLLMQGLARDLARWRRARAAPAVASRRVMCVCVESTLGLGAIAAGGVLSLAWTSLGVPVPPIAWPLAAAAVLAFGFLTKDVVLDWKQRRIRREQDHAVVMSWKG